jgi:hypothetical protein
MAAPRLAQQLAVRAAVVDSHLPGAFSEVAPRIPSSHA